MFTLLLVLSAFLSVLVINCAIAMGQESNEKVFYVYDEAENPKFVWDSSGWMPADGVGAISFADKFTKNCHNGSKTCIKIAFNATKSPWVGIYWLPSGSWSGPGINVYKQLQVDEGAPIKLTLWAKGNTGKERVQFKVGGVSDGNDSIEFPAETDYITLEKEWEQYEIDLSEEDLSNVVGGFCWVTSKDQNPGKKVVRFFLDDIRYEVIK